VVGSGWVVWSEVDLDARPVEVDWKLIRIEGEGCGRCHGQRRRRRHPETSVEALPTATEPPARTVADDQYEIANRR
jgi:hypothetical protein